MNNSLSILVWVIKARQNKAGQVPIYGRVTIDGKRVEISLKYDVDYKLWNPTAQCVRGKSEESRLINAGIENFKIKIRKIHEKIAEAGDYCDAEQIKNIYLGVETSNYTLLQVFEKHITDMEARKKIDYAPATIVKYKTTKKHLIAFIKKQYKKDDLYFKEIKRQFIADYEFYLRIDAKHNLTSVSKNMQRLKKIIRIALINGWLEKDPFSNYRFKYEKSTRTFLTQEELTVIEEKNFPVERIAEVRDIFIFSCYTGIAYIDIFNLTQDHIIIGIDGGKWIQSNRQKNDSRYSVPLLPHALRIIEKYSDCLKTKYSGKLLPVISNQKMNAYLKEIANLCGIKKNLTFHMARHTFATTVTLTNGVPIETVSKILGHSSIKTTQIYAKVVENKISEDMLKLKERLIGTSVATIIQSEN